MLKPTMIIDKASFSRVTKYFLSALALIFIVGLGVSSAQKGKVAGQILDAKTLEPLPGVNVLVEGTSIGAATDIDGFYSLINLTAGTYTIRITYVGYAPYVVNNVVVSIGLTTEINAKISEEVFQGEEVIVQAERPVVQVDISSNQANFSNEEIKNLPIASVSAVVGLQAGADGLSIRGGGTDELSFNVNGLTMRDERTNQPLTNISFTSISNIQVQTGGFNAEYGNIRSGLINVTTKEGSRDKYEVDALIRYTPAQPKNLDEYPNGPNSFLIRPFLDDAVAWTGTSNGAWDSWTKDQYPSFEGWYKISERLLSDSDPSNDLTPEAAQQLFKWQMRKSFEITNPDYDIDLNIGGPVPGIGKMLGDLRFNFSLRKTQNMYMIPLATDRYLSDSYMLKFTSDLAKGMKLSLEGMYGYDGGTTASRSGSVDFFVTSGGIAGEIDRVSFQDTRIYSDSYWNPSDRKYFSAGATFTHSLSANTYYEVKYNNVTTFYNTHLGRSRDTTGVFSVGGLSFDEGPYGFNPLPSNGIGSGMRMGVGMSVARDSSMASVNTLKFDLTSQINRFNQFKTGFEFNHTLSDINYASVDSYLSSSNTYSKWNRNPLRFAAYVQDKLEFEGMVANVGVRMDVSSPNGQWYDYDPYENALGTQARGLDTLLQKKDIAPQVMFSPRLGVSFPITTKSKLFFNYGHFYSMPRPENLYLVRFVEGNQVTFIANPNIKLPKTVAYELGYEQDLFDQYLIRISGYYQDVSQQSGDINYRSGNGVVSYARPEATNYRDVRGFEFTVQKVKGKYFRALANYTYRITSSGYFDFRYQYQNPSDQRNYERTTTANNISKPVPAPLARLVLDLFTPDNYGPKFAGINPLGAWSLNMINTWRSGSYRTWTGGGDIPGILYNTQDVDRYNTDLRITKDIRFSKTSKLNMFLEVSNVFGLRYLSMDNAGFSDGNDFLAYMRSLHLPGKVLSEIEGSYLSVPGDDRPGVYREPGVDYVPIVSLRDVNAISNPSERPLYYDYENKEYYQFKNGAMVKADSKLVDQVLKDKAYIDMPNMNFFNFINPRTFRLGFRISF